PQYTRPPVFAGRDVPEVLRSGDHGAVARWRRAMALERTARHRPDLLRPETSSVSAVPPALPAAPPPAPPAAPAAPAGEAAAAQAHASLRRRSGGGARAATGPDPTPSEHE
ncbi:MAG: tRNA (guanosine(37)-N1)-methyltransferase TrmD, partial [Candidatus Limnocylindrales bacterium]